MDDRFHDTTVVVIGGSSGMASRNSAAALDAGADVVITGVDRTPRRRGERPRRTARSAPLDSTDETRTRALFESIDVVHHIFVSAGAVGAGAHLRHRATATAPRDPRVGIGVRCEVRRAADDRRRLDHVCSGVSSIRPRPGGSSIASRRLRRSRRWRGRSPSSSRDPRQRDRPRSRRHPARVGDVRRPAADAMQAVGKSLPVGRVGQPEDIADAVLFLMGTAT